MPFEKNPFTPEDYKPGSSDSPWTKPPKERVSEAQARDLSPEDKAALQELMGHYQLAKKSGDTQKINEAADEIGELIGRRLDDEDLAVLAKELHQAEEWEEKEEEEQAEKTSEPTKITSGAREKTETVGRERTRYGATLPSEISPERQRVLEAKGPSTKTLTRGRRGRALRKSAGKRAADDKGRKPRETKRAA